MFLAVFIPLLLDVGKLARFTTPYNTPVLAPKCSDSLLKNQVNSTKFYHILQVSGKLQENISFHYDKLTV